MLQGFVPAYFPVPKSPSSQYPFCSKQESAVSETFRSNQGAGSFQPAQLSSPFSCADTSTFVPVDVQVEPNDKNGSYQEYAAYEHPDLSAETASSMERALYADTKPQAEVSFHVLAAVLSLQVVALQLPFLSTHNVNTAVSRPGTIIWVLHRRRIRRKLAGQLLTRGIPMQQTLLRETSAASSAELPTESLPGESEHGAKRLWRSCKCE